METIRIINDRKINLNLGKRIIYTKTKSNINKYRYKRKISKQKYISKTFLAILVFFLLLFIILIITRKSFSKSLKQTVEFIYNLFKKDIYSFKKSETYDEKGVKIYSLTGTLSFKRLDEAFYRKKTNTSQFNHIHVAMSFDVNYYLLSSVTIASLLKNADKTTYIHLHLIIFNAWNFTTMKKLNSLKYKINNNTEFIFHNGQRAVNDFGTYITKQIYGIGEYARMLAPIFAKEADRIIITDSGDIYFKKDLFELYSYPMEGKFVKGVIDPFTPCFTNFTFFNKDNYFNSGVLLLDAKLWREMNLYEDIINIYNGFNYTNILRLPIQDIMNHFFPSITVGNLPVRYNFQGVIDENGNGMCSYIYSFHCSKFFKKDEIFEEEKNIVIRHSNKCKVYNGEGEELKNEWNELAKLTGFYDEICQKYPKGC